MNFQKRVINGFIREELTLFRVSFDLTPYPEVQDRRSFAIAWLCLLFDNIISTENRKSIIKFVDEIQSREDYSTVGWYRISAFQAAAYILSGQIHYATKLLSNIGCGQSWARGYIHESASLICTLLSFDNQILKKEVETNLIRAQNYYIESTLLLLATKGNPNHKRDWLDVVHDKCQLSSSLKFIEELQRNQGQSTGFYVDAFNAAKSYLILKMLCKPVFESEEISLFRNEALDFDQIHRMERKHPLNKTLFYQDW